MEVGYHWIVLLSAALTLFTTSVFGNCQFDQRCFRYAVGCTLANAYPYDRTICTCTQCLNRCLAQGPGYCRSVVYDGKYGTCDLFAVNAMFPPQRLMKWRGRCYFQPTGLCQIGPPPPPPAPPAESCPSGQTAKLVAIKDYQMPGFSGTTVPNVDQKGCEQACLKNKLPDGKSIDCKAAQFSGNQCILATSQGSGVEGRITAASGTTFYQKLCFPTASVANCPDVFEEDPQKILVGQNKQTIDASSLQDCMQKCLDSQKNYGFVCKSGMFFYEDPQLNCILNIESKSTKPDLFTTAPDKVTYFEPGCNGGQKLAILAVAAKTLKKSALVKDQPVIKGDWTMWSPCNQENKQYRFMQCNKSDPRKCQRQGRECGDKSEDEDMEAWFKTGAMMDAENNNTIHDGNARSAFTPCQSFFGNGKKNCTFGSQVVDGDIIYCTNPVDC